MVKFKISVDIDFLLIDGFSQVISEDDLFAGIPFQKFGKLRQNSRVFA